MRIICFGRGSNKSPLLLVEDSEKRRYHFVPERLKFAEFLSQIHAKPVKHDDKILSLYPINLRKND